MAIAGTAMCFKLWDETCQRNLFARQFTEVWKKKILYTRSFMVRSPSQEQRVKAAESTSDGTPGHHRYSHISYSHPGKSILVNPKHENPRKPSQTLEEHVKHPTVWAQTEQQCYRMDHDAVRLLSYIISVGTKIPGSIFVCCATARDIGVWKPGNVG